MPYTDHGVDLLVRHMVRGVHWRGVRAQPQLSGLQADLVNRRYFVARGPHRVRERVERLSASPYSY